MAFDKVTDKYGDTFSPTKRVNHKGRVSHLAFLEPYSWGGITRSGLFVSHEMEDLPMVYGVIRAIHHESPVCLLNLARDAGGIMPGDLIHYPRHATYRVSTLDMTTDRDGTDYTFEVPLLAIVDTEILARVDGILPDPWLTELKLLENPTRKLLA